MERSQLMRHRVTNTQECVCESHTRHCCGISHFFSCFNIRLSVIVGTGKIFENVFKCLKRKTVGIIRREHCGIGFNCVSYRVNTGSRRKTFGSGHMEVRINN